MQAGLLVQLSQHCLSPELATSAGLTSWSQSSCVNANLRIGRDGEFGFQR